MSSGVSRKLPRLEKCVLSSNTWRTSRSVYTAYKVSFTWCTGHPLRDARRSSSGSVVPPESNGSKYLPALPLVVTLGHLSLHVVTVGRRHLFACRRQQHRLPRLICWRTLRQVGLGVNLS